jgi:hypothetical protein
MNTKGALTIVNKAAKRPLEGRLPGNSGQRSSSKMTRWFCIYLYNYLYILIQFPNTSLRAPSHRPSTRNCQEGLGRHSVPFFKDLRPASHR